MPDEGTGHPEPRHGSTGPKIAVVGLGAIGSMTLLALAQRGVDVIGFEANVVGDDRAAFGGETRRFRYAIPGEHGSSHVKLARRAMERWVDLQSACGEELYRPLGELAIGPIDDIEMLSLQDCMRSEGIAHDILSPDQVGLRFPQHRLAADEVGIFAHEGGQLKSNIAVIAAVRTAQRLGAQVRERAKVTSVQSGSAMIEVTVDGESTHFDHVIVTAGPRLAELVPALSHAFSVRRILSTWFEPDEMGSFQPTEFPPGFRRSHSGHSYTFLPGIDGSAAKFILWIAERPLISEPQAWLEEADEGAVALTAQALEATLRHVKRAPARATSYLETFTLDRWPVVESPEDGITVLTGFSGSGFALAPVFGEIASDLATLGVTPHDISAMKSERFHQLSQIGQPIDQLPSRG